MNEQNECPLTPAQLDIVRVSFKLRTFSSKRIGKYLNRSPLTVDTEWKQIRERLGVHSREGAKMVCEANGWVGPDDPPESTE